MARRKNRKAQKKKPQQQVKIVYRDPPKPKNSVLGDLGALAGNSISKFFGLGAYNLKQNTVMDAWNRQVPFMHSTNEKIVFRHREFITDVVGSSSFATSTFNINAGLEETFPYLSQIAANFEEYRFKGLVFEYKSTSATALNSTNTALGTVVLAAQYRADSTPFTNKMQMENAVWAATTRPSENVFLPIECDPDERPMRCGYVRTGQLASGQDIKFYDLAKVTLGTVGMQAAATIGELWATYEVELSKPILVAQGGAMNETALYFATSGITSTTCLGANGTFFCDTMGMSVTNAGQKLVFPKGVYGRYRISLIVQGTSTALTGTVTRVLNNCTAINAYPSGAASPNALSIYGSGGTSTNLMLEAVIEIPDPNLQASIEYQVIGIPSSPNFTQLMINQVPATYPLTPTV